MYMLKCKGRKAQRGKRTYVCCVHGIDTCCYKAANVREGSKKSYKARHKGKKLYSKGKHVMSAGAGTEKAQCSKV